MTARRKLSTKYKLTTRTIPVVIKRLETFVRAAGLDHDREFRGRRLSNEHSIPIMILHFLDRPLDEQLALFDRWRPVYEGMVEAYEAGADAPADVAPAAPAPGGVIEPAEVRAAPPKGRPRGRPKGRPRGRGGR